MIDPLAPNYDSTPADSNRPVLGYCPADTAAPPVVTFVTPYYNTGSVFHETAQAVFGQSLQQWEWLIIDDGSTDPAALEVLDAYRGCDLRVRVIAHSRNCGLPASRNTGFAHARAPYVLQLDSDDLIEPTTAELWAWYLEARPEAAFVTGYTVGFGAQRYLWRDGFHNPDTFLRANAVDATCMVRVSAHQAVGGYDELRRGGLEDWDFWLRCANAGLWGDTVPLYLDWYRRRDSHTDRWEALGAGRQRAFAEEARARYPRLWREGMPQLAQRVPQPFEPIPESAPFDNLLRGERPRVLLLIHSFGPSAGAALDTARALAASGYALTIAATSGGDTSLLPVFARVTSDVFALPLFLRPVDQPRFLGYLLRSRSAHALVIAGSVPGALLIPALRAAQPGLVVISDTSELPADPENPELATHSARAAVECARLELEADVLRGELSASPEPSAVRALRGAYYWALGSGLCGLRPARDLVARLLGRG